MAIIRCENIFCDSVKTCFWENFHMLECPTRKRYLNFMFADKRPGDTAAGKLLRKRLKNSQPAQLQPPENRG